MNDIENFEKERKERIENQASNTQLQIASEKFMQETIKSQYSYNFSWMGVPIIQYPQDIVAMQDIIWKVKPDLIIEMGVARGGSIIYYASMLKLLGGERRVLGVDIDIREHNREAIENHPMSDIITLIEGPSTDNSIVEQVYGFAKGKKNILVILDSHHSHDHVFNELRLYSPLVNKGSYLVVFDTIIESLPVDTFDNRDWDKGNNPHTAIVEFLKTTERFEVDNAIDNQLLVTVAPGGYLKCVKGLFE